MEILYILIPIALLLGSIWIALFILSAKSGQFDDLETPANKILVEQNKNV